MAASAQVQRVSPKRNATDSSMPAKPNKMKAAKAMKDLDLNKVQKGKLKALKQEQKAAKDAIDNDATLTTQQKEEKTKALRKQFLTNMQEILTPEQKRNLMESRKKQADTE
ncbi:MAG: hypothetical protein JWQ27_3042 [Ferruginibacter sp.]|nr:hypothetical protein [Ferruginibacter sp.]